MKKILCATDGSHSAKKAVVHAVELAKLADAAIITAMTNGSAGAPMAVVMDNTTGITSTAAALLVTTSVSADTEKYTSSIASRI